MAAAKDEPRQGREGEVVLVVVIVLAALGLTASIWLNHLHYKVHTDSSFSSFCALSEEVNCETVALSPWSVFLRIPVSYWGIAAHVAYLLFAGLALVDLRRRRPGGARGWGALTVMSVIGVAVSVALFCIAHWIIRSMCPFCMTIYILNLGIAAAVTVHLVRRGTGPIAAVVADARAFVFKPVLGILIVPVAIIAAGYCAYPLVYDTGVCPGGKKEDLCSEPSTYGDPGARIRIVEYSDYQCPFCAMTHFALRKAVETYPRDVVIEHVNFPLDASCNDLLDRPFHAHACAAARASMCAQRQGRFWEMNDWLFTHQKSIGRVGWDDVAEAVGLETGSFSKCMQDPSSLAEVRADIDRARGTDPVKQGAVGTPIIVIDGVATMGALHWEDLERQLVQKYGLTK